MFDAQIGGFLLVAVVIAITPGPDMLLMAKHTLSSGRRAGLASGTGICAGLFVHAAAAALGLSAIIASSAAAFTAVKIVGAAYLMFIGLSGLLSAVRGGHGNWTIKSGPTSTDVRRLFRQGLLTNVLNPKVAILFLSVLPQFIDPNKSSLAQTLLLSGLFILIGLVWVTFYVNLLATTGQRMLTAGLRRWIEGISGTVLVGLGLRLLVEER